MTDNLEGMRWIDTFTPAHRQPIERCVICGSEMAWVFETIQKCRGCGYHHRVFGAYDTPSVACGPDCVPCSAAVKALEERDG